MVTLSNADYEENWEAVEYDRLSSEVMELDEGNIPNHYDPVVLDKLLSDWEIYEDEYFLFESGFTVLTKEQAWEQYISELEDQESYDYQESGQYMDDFCTYAYWLGALRCGDGKFTLYDTQGNLITEYTKEPLWETLYEMYCEEQELIEGYHLEEYNFQQEITKKDRIYSRKNKRIKDTKRNFRDIRKKRCWLNYRGSSVEEQTTFKHLRSQKQYEDFYTAYEEEDIDFSWGEGLESEAYYLNEIGFDWEKVLYDCINCKDISGHCDCYETVQKVLGIEDSLMYNKILKETVDIKILCDKVTSLKRDNKHYRGFLS